MRTPLPRMSRRGRVTLIVLATVIVLFMLLGWLVNALTDYLWFSEVHYTAVFTTVLWTRIGLFLVFGVLFALLVWFNLWLAYRLRPLLRPHSAEQQSLDRYRMLLTPRFGVWVGILAAIVGFFTGISAQGQWRTWLLFANRQNFGQKDPQFHLDVGFYVFDLPFWRYLLGLGFTLVVLCVLGSLAVHYLFGGVRLQGAGERMTAAARAHLTALVAVFVLLKAIAYFLDQRGLVLSHNSGTGLWGAGYTDVNALLPAKEILAWISVVVAVAILVFSNAFIRNLVWPGIAIGMLALSAVAIGGIYPAAVQTFQVKPNIRDKEINYIERSIQATRQAYGLTDVDTAPYQAGTSAPAASLTNDTDTVGNVRLLDPSVVTPAYTQLQQVRGFYDFGEKLDIDRYTINGKLQDYVVGVRELDYNKLSGQQTNWQNRHTIYTHGYGFTAAPANETACQGQPFFVSGFLDKPANSDQLVCQSDTDQIPVDHPQVYYGEGMDGYAIVGKAPDGHDVEYDRPTGSQDQYITYTGNGGVPIGSYWRRMLYAYHEKETNFLISSVFNSNSKILYNRDPRDRVQKIAPFLTLDGDPYPAVINGKILWILDGYTTASTYPYSDVVDMKSATSDSLTGEGTIAQQSQNINYLRNSVKATVDAYTGEVKLYEFGSKDPVLEAWNKAFGGKYVATEIPPELAQHFRYPEDQFKVQREILSRFHVTDPQQFYSGQDFWQVPDEPSESSNNVRQAPYYLLAKFPKQNQATFQLTSAMVPRGRPNLASLITATYTDGKPKLQILQLPVDTQVYGPVQAHQKMTNNDVVRPKISQTQISGNILYGNLLSLPVGDGMLYVEPLYVQSKTASSLLQLQYVVVNFGQYTGIDTTLQGALRSLLAAAGGQAPPPTTSSPPTTTTPPNQAGSSALQAAVDQINKALNDVKAAQQSGDLGKLGQALQELQTAIAAYQQAQQAGAPAATPSGSPSATPSSVSSDGGGGSASPSPSG